jgi:hypothetical protein
MKKSLLLLTALTVVSTNAFAKNLDCKGTSDLAGVIMESRLVGVTMADMFNINEDGNKTIEKMIIQAYESPAYSTEKYQQNAILEFKNKWFMACVKSSKK